MIVSPGVKEKRSITVAVGGIVSKKTDVESCLPFSPMAGLEKSEEEVESDASISPPYTPTPPRPGSRPKTPFNKNARYDALIVGGSGMKGKRRVRCMQCPACLTTEDCGKCVHCK